MILELEMLIKRKSMLKQEWSHPPQPCLNSPQALCKISSTKNITAPCLCAFHMPLAFRPNYGYFINCCGEQTNSAVLVMNLTAIKECINRLGQRWGITQSLKHQIPLISKFRWNYMHLAASTTLYEFDETTSLAGNEPSSFQQQKWHWVCTRLLRLPDSFQ